MEATKGDLIQGMPLGRGNATSPYTVQEMDTVVEFLVDGDVVCKLDSGATTTTSVLAGGRYAIGKGVVTITTTSTFSIG